MYINLHGFRARFAWFQGLIRSNPHSAPHSDDEARRYIEGEADDAPLDPRYLIQPANAAARAAEEAKAKAARRAAIGVRHQLPAPPGGPQRPPVALGGPPPSSTSSSVGSNKHPRRPQGGQGQGGGHPSAVKAAPPIQRATEPDSSPMYFIRDVDPTASDMERAVAAMGEGLGDARPCYALSLPAQKHLVQIGSLKVAVLCASNDEDLG